MHLSPAAPHAILWVIFGLVYLAMAVGTIPFLGIDRTGAALLGAIAMIAARGISLHDAAKSVDYETILLLFGLMLFSAQLKGAGFYAVVGERLTHLAQRPRVLLAGIILAGAGLSALLANDIVCLAFTPILCAAICPTRRDPIPYLVAVATSSNIGSAATIIGNPQNMYIGTVGRLPFAHFALVMLPPVIVALALCWVTIALLWRKTLGKANGAPGDAAAAAAADVLSAAHAEPLDRGLVTKTLGILTGVVAVFLFAGHEWRVIAALAGGGLLLVSRRKGSAHLYLRTDWNLLLLFFGLFVVNGAMKEQGLTRQMMDAISRLGLNLQHLPTLSAVTTVLSNVVSNVPAVLLLQPSIPPDSHRHWYLLALVSTWAGNLTLVGSIANLIVAEQAKKFGVTLDLKSYCKAGIPLTIVTVVLGTLWVAAVVRG